LPEVISSGRQLQTLPLSSASISVLDAEDIHYSGSTTIPELLQFVPSLDVLKIDRNRAAIGARGLHQGFADRTIEGLDKHPLYGVSLRISLEAQLELIPENLPRARRVGTLYNSKIGTEKQLVANVRNSLPDGLALEAVDISKFSKLKDAIKELYARDIDVVWTSSKVRIYNAATLSAILLAGLKKKVPVFGFALNVIKMGALMGVYVDPLEHGRQVAALTHELINSSKRPKNFSDPKFKVGLNRVVARRLRIRLSEQAYQQVDYVKK